MYDQVAVNIGLWGLICGHFDGPAFEVIRRKVFGFRRSLDQQSLASLDGQVDLCDLIDDNRRSDIAWARISAWPASRNLGVCGILKERLE